MKTVIWAGGLGSRLGEETDLKPKPMVSIGGMPILWHIMKIYSSQGFTDFIICCGYKGDLIKEYFANYFLHMSDVTFDMEKNEMQVHQNRVEPWKVTLVDTGENANTGGRLKRISSYLEGEPAFFCTYGDGLADIDLEKLLAFHREHGRLATLTSVTPPGRFGALDVSNGIVKKFDEKPSGDNGKINGGFFALSPRVIEYIEGDTISWEQEPLRKLCGEGQLMAFDHDGFWQPMDTLRDKRLLEKLWDSNSAPWKVW